ncbi:PAS domain-containing sensor histidine kinase [Salinivibrio sp. MA351]|uniref:PAS domain-containing sensor histidine kinase n=1 Tax=Salinivibrio sp. MA351 TaxID=1909453 RepID=UPI000988FE8A|nr:ATP-binding protein [Salinivibrio sp. MA351]OOE96212.1 PAS domain-containing sensor histidine kinase [Salinivibrio sp. MA351]
MQNHHRTHQDSKKTWAILFLSGVLVLFFYGISREAAYQGLSVQTHAEVQNKLLNYIGDVRRALRRFYHLPYLLTNHPDTLAIMKGERHETVAFQVKLTQLDKAANTEGWTLLSTSGDVLASSLIDERFSRPDRLAIVEQVLRQGEGVSLVNKTKGYGPLYYLSAPVFDDLNIAGIVVVQIDLSFLTEQPIASDDLILLQNRQQRFFLSSSSQYSADWLNAAQLNAPTQGNKQTVERQTRYLYDSTAISQWRFNATPFLGHTVKLDDLKWSVSYLTPYKPIKDTANLFAWGVAAVLLVVILLLIIGQQRQQKHRHQQRIQSLLQESQRRLKQMIDKTQVGLLLIDEQGSLYDLNPMAKRLFGLPENNHHRIFAWELFDTGNPHSTTLTLLKNLDKHNELAELNAVETMARRSDSSVFPALFSLTRFPWHDEQYYLATLIDISKRKKAEQSLQQMNQALTERVEERTQALQQAQAQLIEASKMAALGRMSSAITHELNQPLTGLRTLLTSNTLLTERGETEKVKANNQLVQKLIDRMTNMTSQLKTFAYNKPHHLHAVSLPDALNETLRVYQAQLANIDVRVRMPHDTPMILGEGQRLLQILGNLVSNACDAMTNTAAPTLVFGVTPAKTAVEMTVSDNGCGASAEALESMFEPFVTSKKIGEGLGLGLAITANNVRDINGKIRVAPNSQGGLTFTLTFQPAS